MKKVRKSPGAATLPKRELTIGEVASLGGTAAMKNLTPEQRKEKARNAANKRWHGAESAA